MTASGPPLDPAAAPNIVDTNLDRLITEAYQPDAPAADLLARVQQRMQAAAQAAPAERRARQTEAQRILSMRRRWSLGLSAAVMAAGIALIWYSFHLPTRHGNPRGPGQVAQANEPGELTAKAPVPGKPLDEVKPGSEVRTEAGERRRVKLADGSIIYLNEKTTLAVDAERHVSLKAGEVFVEVMPQESKAKFSVKAGSREVTALGTKFAVKAEDGGKSRVTVTQGRVKVSGDVDQELTTGQQLDAGKTVISARRASYDLDWTRDVMAASETPLVPGSQYSGGALVAVDTMGQQAKLTLRKYHVDVHIEDGFARTIIDQTYFNHAPGRMEGTFYFPLPADASLSRLAMYVDGKLMEGGMEERDYAQGVYDQITWSQRDPALLEWVDGSTFKMRVFPLESRQEKRIIIGYSQRLSSLYGQAQYRFPAGHNLGLVQDWSFHARLKDGAKYLLSSDTFALRNKPEEDPAKRERYTLIQTTEQPGGKDQPADVVLDGKIKNDKFDRDVVLTLVDPTDGLGAGAAPGAPMPNPAGSPRFSVAEADGSRYLMLRYRPELDAGSLREARDWVFLFESSGDRDPLLARVQIDVLHTLLDNAEHGDTFRILTAGTRVHEFNAEAKPATRENIKSAIEYLNHSHLIGALDLGQALTKAAERLPAANTGRVPYLVHLGTGIAAMGEHRPDVLAKMVPTGTRYVGVAVGKRWSRDFMKAAAERSGGYFTQINPDEQVSWRAFDLSATLNTPRLMNVKVTATSGAASFLTFATALSQGEELCAVTQLPAGTPMPPSLKVSGTMLDGKPFEAVVPVPAAVPTTGHLPRTWAKLEIERLLADGSDKNKQAIVNLSKAMYVMTPFTSLLVLENEEMYQRFKVDTGRKDHWAAYATPAQIAVKYEPEVGQPIDARFAPKTEKPLANQILQTIYVRQVPPALTSAYHPSQYQPWNVSALQVYRGAFAAPIDADMEGEALGGDLWALEAGDHPSANSGPGRLDFQQAEQALFRSARGEHKEAGEPLAKRLLGDGAKGEGRRNQSKVGALKRDMVTRQLRSLDRAADAPQNAIFAASPAPMNRPARDALSKANTFYRLQESAKKVMEKQGHDKDSARKKLDESDDLMQQVVFSGIHEPEMYSRASFSNHEQVFTDLLTYAPGMNSSSADIEAVLEAEAMPGLGSLLGTLDPAAKALIDGARKASWQTLSLNMDGEAEVKVVFDGQGRYAYDRTLTNGLREQVVCDGTTLFHLYPELGVGARRTVTRFHRAQFANLVPWLVQPAEDLVRGADVQKIDDHTVALIPRGADAVRDDDGKLVAYHCTHLVFGANGQLAERRIVEVAADRTTKVVFTEKYDGNVIRQFGDDGKEREAARRELKLGGAEEPSLKPDVSSLVVLPMPWRNSQTVAQKYGIDLNRFWNNDENWTLTYTVSPEAANALIGAAFAERNVNLFQFAHRLLVKDNRADKIGYYTLMLGSDMLAASDGDFLRLAATSDTPLARYLALTANPLYRNLHVQYGLYLSGSVGPKDSLLGQVGGFRDLYLRWQQGNVSWKGTPIQQRVEQERALQFVKENRRSVLGWAMLSILQDRAHDPRFQQDIAASWKMFDDGTELGYTSAYEEARSLLRAGKKAEAATKFRDLYLKALEKGYLPPLDGEFRQALLPNDLNGEDAWTPLMKQTSQELLKRKQRTAIVRLAWQAYQLDDAPLAENLVDFALENSKGEDRLTVHVAAIEFLLGTNQAAKADTLVTALLADSDFAKRPLLWRLASRVADHRRLEAAAIGYLERALDLEYHNLPEVINLQQVRADYDRLLSHYRMLAGAVAAMEITPPPSLLPRTIRAADRWRALDREGSGACEQAAAILTELRDHVPNAREMAWDYLTTPVGMQPNQSGPWAALGKRLTDENTLDLANLAYKAAAESEPTNARLLWERAQTLRRASKLDEARKILQQIVDRNDWSPQYASIKSQARWQLEGRR